MIISCPACGTRYEVPDSAIGASGRRLKCAACGNGWHATAADAVTHEEAAAAEPPEPAPAPRPMASPMASPVVADPLPEPPVVPVSPPPTPPAAAEPEHGPGAFDYNPPFEQERRGGWRWLLWLMLILLLLAGIGYAVVRTNPELARQLNLAAVTGPSPVVISFTSKPERRSMDSGNELLAVAGRITNPTESPQKVPDIRAELRDSQGRTVYGWVIGAPTPRLAPGQSADFNSAEVDVPPAARTIHLRPSTPQA